MYLTITFPELMKEIQNNLKIENFLCLVAKFMLCIFGCRKGDEIAQELLGLDMGYVHSENPKRLWNAISGSGLGPMNIHVEE